MEDIIEEKVRFENITKNSSQERKRLCSFYAYKKNKMQMILIIICTIILITASIGFIILKSYILSSIYFIIAIFSSIWLIKLPSILNHRIKNKSAQFNTEENKIMFYETLLELENNLIQIRVNYKDIIKIYETNTNFYIYYTKTSLIIISKSGFKNNKIEEFTKFLEKKFKNIYKSK